MKKLFSIIVGVLLAFSVYAADPVVTQTMGDDGYVNVPLQFNFPYYGQTFNNSWMYDNGIVSFIDPATDPRALSPWQWYASPLEQAAGSYYIATLWADIAPTAGTTYTTQGGTTYQTYNWNNIAEYYSIGSGTGLRLNNFNLKIEDTGNITATYTNINLQTSNIAIGTVGDRSLGEVNPIAYYQNGTVLNYVQNWAINQAGDICATNPLSSTTCSGYAQAYLSQQCAVSVLYDPACPGYAQAYYEQQCSVNPLYNVECPGYALAYLNYQCSLDPQYSTTCEGYKSPTTTVQSDPVQTAVPITGDPVVDSTISNTAATSITSTSSVSPAAVTSQVQTTAPPAVTNLVVQTATETKKEETKSESKSEAKQETKNEKPAPSAQQQARVEAVKQKQIEAAKNLANTMGDAVNMKEQAAIQSVVISAMGYVPGFDAYSYKLNDAPFYKPYQVYKNQVNVDNRKSLMQLQGAGGLVYEQMINQQYKE